MSEEIGYSITIGGSITKGQWKRFYVKFRNGDYDYPNLDRDPGTNRLTDCGSCSYGDTSDLRALCRECGLAYEAQADAKYEYDGEFFCWFPGMAAEMEAFGTQDGRPAILIPFAAATGDHQSANARALAESDAAVVLPESVLDISSLTRDLNAILTDAARASRMASAALSMGRPDAAARLYDLVTEISS